MRPPPNYLSKLGGGGGVGGGGVQPGVGGEGGLGGVAYKDRAQPPPRGWGCTMYQYAALSLLVFSCTRESRARGLDRGRCLPPPLSPPPPTTPTFAVVLTATIGAACCCGARMPVSERGRGLPNPAIEEWAELRVSTRDTE